MAEPFGRGRAGTPGYSTRLHKNKLKFSRSSASSRPAAAPCRVCQASQGRGGAGAKAGTRGVACYPLSLCLLAAAITHQALGLCSFFSCPGVGPATCREKGAGCYSSLQRGPYISGAAALASTRPLASPTPGGCGFLMPAEPAEARTFFRDYHKLPNVK